MFIVIGAVGALLLLITLVFDDVIDDLVPGLDFISGPVVGAFLVAFGAFGWYLDAGPELPLPLAALIALAAGVLFGGFAFRFSHLLAHQPTDATPTTESLVGRSARVVTPVRANGIGEVIVELGGAPTKYSATADNDLATGTAVVVIAVESPTKLRVESDAQFWS
jgi:membrane protein implicated in regulation of membrane protease activity